MQNNNQQKTTSVHTALAVKLYHAMIWPEHKPKNKELKLIRRRIHAFIENGASPYDKYIEFVERLCIAQRYTLIHTSKPYFTIWLYHSYKYGISATNICYEHILAVRQINPLFHAAQKAFAHAMLDIHEEGEAMQAYWFNWFTERNETKFAAMLTTILSDRNKGIANE